MSHHFLFVSLFITHETKYMVFYKVGTCINKFRWPIIVVWILILLGCIPFMSHIMEPFKTTGFVDEHSESARTERSLDKAFGYDSKNKFIIMYHSSKYLTTDPIYLKKIKRSLADLTDFPIKHDIILPYEHQQTSKNKHTAYVVILLKTKKTISDKLLDQFRSSIKKPSHMSIQIGGEPEFVENVTHQTQIDLYKADSIATPVAIITLLFVFGSVVAAILPVILGGGCALIILSTLYFFGHYVALSVFTINIALLLGLCLSLDYSLFFINRFRDELDNGLNISEAIYVTQPSAGLTIFLSG